MLLAMLLRCSKSQAVCGVLAEGDAKDLLQQGVCHWNPAVQVLAMRLVRAIVNADLAPASLQGWDWRGLVRDLLYINGEAQP